MTPSHAVTHTRNCQRQRLTFASSSSSVCAFAVSTPPAGWVNGRRAANVCVCCAVDVVVSCFTSLSLLISKSSQPRSWAQHHSLQSKSGQKATYSEDVGQTVRGICQLEERGLGWKSVFRGAFVDCVPLYLGEPRRNFVQKVSSKIWLVCSEVCSWRGEN